MSCARPQPPPTPGIEFLQREGMLGRSPEEVSSFLARTEGLDKTMIGDYLGEREDTSLKVGQGRPVQKPAGEDSPVHTQ